MALAPLSLPAMWMAPGHPLSPCYVDGARPPSLSLLTPLLSPAVLRCGCSPSPSGSTTTTSLPCSGSPAPTEVSRGDAGGGGWGVGDTEGHVCSEQRAGNRQAACRPYPPNMVHVIAACRESHRADDSNAQSLSQTEAPSTNSRVSSETAPPVGTE